MTTEALCLLAVIACLAAGTTAFAQQEAATAGEPIIASIKLDTILTHDDGKFLWFHPRAAAVPGAGKAGAPAVVLTLQKHLRISDFYSGINIMRTDDMGGSWSGPDARKELAWQELSENEQISVCDVTPGWHAPTGKIIAIGVKLHYKDGHQVSNEPRFHEAAYAIFDPKTGAWTKWRIMAMPDTDTTFYKVTPGCTQWIVEPDGSILLPIYFAGPGEKRYTSTVLRCTFDGETLRYVEHGNTLALEVARGIYEPSIAKFGGKYYLTLRNDEKGYVAVSEDGLQYGPIKPWTFDDGTELGSYNTQQHWLTHSGGLFLTYTRRGANNDHVPRHRAPIFIAQVDPERLCVVRDTERVLVPERGATLGNWGAASINEDESWVTVSEGVWGDDARKRGATGATFVARVIWAKPNKLMAESR